MGHARSAASMSMVSPSSYKTPVYLRSPNGSVDTERMLTVYFKVGSVEDKDSLSSDESEIEIISPIEDASQRRKTQKANFEALSVTETHRFLLLKVNILLDSLSGLIPVMRELSLCKIPRYLPLDSLHPKITSRAL